MLSSTAIDCFAVAVDSVKVIVDVDTFNPSIVDMRNLLDYAMLVSLVWWADRNHESVHD
jgi:hypothetical protein